MRLGGEHVHDQFEVIATMLGRQLPKVEQMLRDAATTCSPSPASRSRTGRRSGRPTRSSGLNKEVKRRTDVAGVFPKPAALLRLAGGVLVEAHHEWQVTADRRYLSEGSMTLLTAKNNPGKEVAKPELMTA
jgi:putative transposase